MTQSFIYSFMKTGLLERKVEAEKYTNQPHSVVGLQCSSSASAYDFINLDWFSLDCKPQSFFSLDNNTKCFC